MLFPRPRFTVRRLMIAVAVVAVVSAFVRLTMREAHCLAMASVHRDQEEGQRLYLEVYPNREDCFGCNRWSIEAHRKAKQKWRRAAFRPWLPVPPEPRPY